MLFQAGQAAESERALAQAILDARPLNIHPTEVGVVWSLLGPVYEYLDRCDSAETAYTKALRTFDAALPPRDGRVVRALAVLTMFLVRTNQLGKADQLAPRLREATGFEPAGIQTAWAWNAVGTLLSRTGRPQEAEQAFERALALERSTTEDVILRGHARSNLGAVFLATSRANDARRVFEAVLHDEQRRVGPASARLIPALTSLAASCQATGDDAAAASNLERALAIAEANLPDNNRVRADLLSRYAQVLRALHRNRESKEVAREARAADNEAGHVQTSTEVVHVAELKAHGMSGSR